MICLGETELNQEKFQDGVNEASYVCGQISALQVVGIEPQDALEYITSINNNMIVADNNVNVANIHAETEVTCFKLGKKHGQGKVSGFNAGK